MRVGQRDTRRATTGACTGKGDVSKEVFDYSRARRVRPGDRMDEITPDEPIAKKTLTGRRYATDPNGWISYEALSYPEREP